MNIDAIMEQAQVFASAYSLGRTDAAMSQRSQDEKARLREMLLDLLCEEKNPAVSGHPPNRVELHSASERPEDVETSEPNSGFPADRIGFADYESAAFIGMTVVEMAERAKVGHAVLPGSRTNWVFEIDDVCYRVVVAVESEKSKKKRKIREPECG